MGKLAFVRRFEVDLPISHNCQSVGCFIIAIASQAPQFVLCMITEMQVWNLDFDRDDARSHVPYWSALMDIVGIANGHGQMLVN